MVKHGQTRHGCRDHISKTCWALRWKCTRSLNLCFYHKHVSLYIYITIHVYIYIYTYYYIYILLYIYSTVNICKYIYIYITISYTYLREYTHCDNIWEHIHHPQPAVTRVFASLAASSCTSGVCLICHESTKPSRWIPVGVCILSLCYTYLLVDKHKGKQVIITKIERNLSLFK